MITDHHEIDPSELTAIGNDDRLGGPPAGRSDLLDRLDDVVTLHDLPEHHVLPVEPVGLRRADEKLRSVRPGAGVRHGEHAGTGVLLNEVLVGELGAVDRLASGAVSGGEVAALAHEVGDHAVEARSLVVERLAGAAVPLLAGAERAKVLRRLGHDVGEELHHDPSGRLAADGHVEENLRVRHLSLSREFL